MADILGTQLDDVTDWLMVLAVKLWTRVEASLFLEYEGRICEVAVVGPEALRLFDKAGNDGRFRLRGDGLAVDKLSLREIKHDHLVFELSNGEEFAVAIEGLRLGDCGFRLSGTKVGHMLSPTGGVNQ